MVRRHLTGARSEDPIGAPRGGRVWPAAVVVVLGTTLGLWLITRYVPPPPSQHRMASSDAIDAANRVFPTPSPDPVIAGPPETPFEPAAAPSGTTAPGQELSTAPPLDAGAATRETPLERAAAPSPSVAMTGFNVVAGSFKDEWRATALSERIVALGLPGRVRAVPGWTQVVVGGHETIEQAEAARERLRQLDIAAVLERPTPSAPPLADATSSPSKPAGDENASRQSPGGASAPAAATGSEKATLFDRARGLAQEGDVRGLLRLRESAESRLRDEGWTPDDIVRMLRDLDPIFDQARRRRHALDAEASSAER